MRSAKGHETAARARFHIKSVKKTEGTGALLEDEVGKRCTRLVMASCRSIMASTSSSQSSCLPHHHQVGGKCKRSGTREFSAPLRSTPFHSSPLQSSRLHSTPLHSIPRHATPRHDPPHPTPPHSPHSPHSSPLLSSLLTSPHLTHSPTQPLTHLPTHPRTSLTYSPTHPLTHSPTHPLHSLHSFIFFNSFISIHFFPAHQESYRQTGSYSHVLFSKLPPRRVPGTTWYDMWWRLCCLGCHILLPNVLACSTA